MNIKLSNLQPYHKKFFFTWLKDKEVIKYSRAIFQKMNNDADISDWFDKLLIDNTTLNRAIIDDDTGNIIGYAGICKINSINLSGEYFIFIGDKRYHGKGIGTLVTKKITNLAFEKVGLNRLMLTASEENIGAIKAYTKAGFKLEGIMRQAFYRNGNFTNKIIMSILREEWTDNDRT